MVQGWALPAGLRFVTECPCAKVKTAILGAFSGRVSAQ